jgi:hypothetical protein
MRASNANGAGSHALTKFAIYDDGKNGRVFADDPVSG